MKNGDYEVLDRFVQMVLKRLHGGKTTTVQAHADIMHPLTAWDKGNRQEFIPWMETRLEEWGDA